MCVSVSLLLNGTFLFYVGASPYLSVILSRANSVSLPSPSLSFSIFLLASYAPFWLTLSLFLLLLYLLMNGSFHPRPHNQCSSSLAETLKNVLAEIFKDRTFCALQAKLETQIPSSLIRCTSNVSYSALKIYVPTSDSHLGHK